MGACSGQGAVRKRTDVAKSEGRNPKAERRPNSEIRNADPDWSEFLITEVSIDGFSFLEMSRSLVSIYIVGQMTSKSGRAGWTGPPSRFWVLKSRFRSTPTSRETIRVAKSLNHRTLLTARKSKVRTSPKPTGGLRGKFCNEN